MNATQPAVVTFGATPGSVEIRDVPIPTIGPDDVLLEVEAVGVCGSDLHMWTGQHGWQVNYPCILDTNSPDASSSGAPRCPPSGVRELGWRCETHAVIDPDGP